MYGSMFFLHITGLAVWLGSLVVLSFLLVMIKRGAGETVKAQIIAYLKLTNGLSHPSALIVLISGAVMLQQLGIEHSDLPFWISFMEQGGTLMVLFSTIVLALVGRRLKKRLLAADGAQAAVRTAGPYRTVLLLTVCGVLAVLGVVSLKIM
ncbi:hypothetical protein EV586_101787 [Tumebacillus sp. BK434]|uniref:hypothetical protein n=1 Tax=Tumebacillus sp. BK434 TaxID=2512169 RepID=UPI00104EA16A|nr:hypothetical protein [Tumebacillus sp. BK434]TCP59558.1 hypothetical protein EV586_101787 [Tumebacillus sp. BK434]